MPLPDRPVANTTIDSEWGQAVHDWTFAPKGCDVWSSTTTVVGTSVTKLNLDMATEDPGGFLDAANDQVEVPTDGDGLYLAMLNLDAVNGDSGGDTRAIIYVNGSSYAMSTENNDGGTHIQVQVTTFIPLSAGDILQAWAQRRSSGSNPTVHVNFMRLIRVGNEYGA